MVKDIEYELKQVSESVFLTSSDGCLNAADFGAPHSGCLDIVWPIASYPVKNNYFVTVQQK